MQITINNQDLLSARDEGTVMVLTGTAENGDRVTFGADRRPADDLADAVVNSLDGEITAEVESWQVLSTNPLRKGRIRRTPGGNPTSEAAARYLPANYQVTGEDDEWVYFAGHNNSGWTMSGYVLPRLASGLFWAEEVPS